jgi:hypothetical protein
LSITITITSITISSRIPPASQAFVGGGAERVYTASAGESGCAVLSLHKKHFERFKERFRDAASTVFAHGSHTVHTPYQCIQAAVHTFAWTVAALCVLLLQVLTLMRREMRGRMVCAHGSHTVHAVPQHSSHPLHSSHPHMTLLCDCALQVCAALQTAGLATQRQIDQPTQAFIEAGDCVSLLHDKTGGSGVVHPANVPAATLLIVYQGELLDRREDASKAPRKKSTGFAGTRSSFSGPSASADAVRRYARGAYVGEVGCAGLTQCLHSPLHPCALTASLTVA